MSDSLQDQLLALGLAKKKPARKSGKKPRKKSGKSASTATGKGPKSGSRPAESDLEKAYRLKREAERAEGERSRRQKQKDDERNRRINQQLRPLVEKHALNDSEAEVVRNFMDRGKIRSLRVTEQQQAAILAGEMGICYLAGRYFLLPGEQVDTVRDISTAHVVDLGINDDEGDAPG